MRRLLALEVSAQEKTDPPATSRFADLSHGTKRVISNFGRGGLRRERSGKKLHAVGALEGLTLRNDWKVEKQVTRPDDATGGVHSCSYIVVKAGRKCFLKAFDFSRAFEAADFAVALQFHTAAYLYERDLLLFCGQKKLRRVVHALDYGEVQVPTYENLNGRVLYLIFELADNNMRGQVSKESRLIRRVVFEP